MKISLNILFILLLFFYSCKKEKQNDIKVGEITIATDESFKNVTEALAERYMAFYPESKIHVKIQKEDFAWIDFLNEKSDVVVLSRKLSTNEQKVFTDKFDKPFEPSQFAGDAVVFVVSKNSTRNNISTDEIKKELLSSNKNIIFDGTNASNLNFVAQKLNLKPKDLQFSIIKGNEQLINELAQFPNHIGVISLNSISRVYNENTLSLRNKIKILSVVDKNIAYEPTKDNIRDMKYPFTRILYFLTNEAYFGLSKGFIRFSCTQIGQIVVGKSGLQPYNIFKREVQMH